MLATINESPAWHRKEVVLAFAMASHPRLGAESPLNVLDGDLLREVLTLLPIVVGGPDGTAFTLKEAMEMALGDGQVISVSKGEHIVGSNPGQLDDTSGLTSLQITRPVRLTGDPAGGTVLRGMLELVDGATSGSISHLTIHDAGQRACVRASVGCWTLDRCILLSGHAAAVRAEGEAQVVARRCRFGGEGEIGTAVALEYELPRQWVDTAGSVQEYGLRKHSCYGLFAQDSASILIDSCQVSYCSESAVFLRDKGSAVLRRSALMRCRIAFTAGEGMGGALHVDDLCRLEEVPQVWYDTDRPGRCAVPFVECEA
ncbi:hypothetical protein T484DRAFT_1953657 [Baffinella frigidus]|nr:hypothetical protein T484DRAFT_1953657 [Cryptophyta sp. CCMP2293]